MSMHAEQSSGEQVFYTANRTYVERQSKHFINEGRLRKVKLLIKYKKEYAPGVESMSAS
jgi:hypothetical protein